MDNSEQQYNVICNILERAFRPAIKMFLPVFLNMVITLTLWIGIYGMKQEKNNPFNLNMLSSTTDFTTGNQFFDGILNAFCLIFLISIVSFGLLALAIYEFKNIIQGWLSFSLISVLFGVFSIYVQDFLKLYNFPHQILLTILISLIYGTIGCLVFFTKKTPLFFHQIYTVINCAMVSVLYLRSFPESTIWYVLPATILWDIFAVWSPSGPLKRVTEKANQYNESILKFMMFTANNNNEDVENENDEVDEDLESENDEVDEDLESEDDKVDEDLESENDEVDEDLESENDETDENLETEKDETNKNVEIKNIDTNENIETENDDNESLSDISVLEEFDIVYNNSINTQNIQITSDKQYDCLIKFLNKKISKLFICSNFTRFNVDEEENKRFLRSTYKSTFCECYAALHMKKKHKLKSWAEKSEKRIMRSKEKNQKERERKEKFKEEKKEKKKKIITAMDALNDDNSVRLGLGDFIFYSLLVGKSAVDMSVMATTASMFGILFGLLITLVFLQKGDIVVPALPIPIFLGILFHFGTFYFVEPFLNQLFKNIIYVF